MKPADAIRQRLAVVPSQRKVAAELGISAGHLNHVLKGRRKAGKRLLEALGLTKKVIYSEDVRASDAL